MSKCKAANTFLVVALGALAALPALLHAQQQDKFNVEQVAQLQVPWALEDGRPGRGGNGWLLKLTPRK
jgi:hypothetical protein